MQRVGTSTIPVANPSGKTPPDLLPLSLPGKGARVWSADRQIGKSLKADSIRRECEASLKRLNIDVIDLYQMHWPEPEEDVEEGWATMAKLKAEGKVRWIGVSNFMVAHLKRAQAIAPVTSLQPPYSLLRREIEADIL